MSTPTLYPIDFPNKYFIEFLEHFQVKNGEINVEKIVEFVGHYIDDHLFKATLAGATTNCKKTAAGQPRCELAAKLIKCELDIFFQ